jgi:3-hydroxyacyl-[acyl-carrier-protein] dehydratase
MSEDFLEFHFPKHPIMPGVLLIEALTQLTGWLEAASSDFEHWFLINRITQCKFYGFALPGDQVGLEVEVIPGQTSPARAYRGVCMVGGKKKVVAEFEGERVPLGDIEDREIQKRFFLLLTREAEP